MRHFRAIYMHYDDVGNKNLELARHTNRARLSKWPNSSNLDPKYKQSKIQLCICARGKLLITYSTTKSRSFFSHFLLLLDVCVCCTLKKVFVLPRVHFSPPLQYF